MYRSFLRIIVIVLMLQFLYRNRYRLINGLLSQSWIRKKAVRFFMKFPTIRNKIFANI